MERLTLDLAEEFLERGYRVDVVLLLKKGEFLRNVPEGVRIIDLAAKRIRLGALPLRKYIRDQRPNAVCAAVWSLTVMALIASIGLRSRTRVIVAEHCPLIAQYRDDAKRTLLLRLSTLASFWLADGIVGTSDGVSDELALLSGLNRNRITTIYNPVGLPKSSGADPDELWQRPGGTRILSVGSLKRAKNFALLIRAFAELRSPEDSTLAIIGEGEERQALEALVRDLGLQGRVLLPGYCLTPGDWYKSADLYVMSSDFEGFGLVLAEAMHFGLPIVSTDCPFGPAEVLGGGRWGRLVPVQDAPALTKALSEMLKTPHDREEQRQRANFFSVERATDQYARLFDVDVQ